MNFILKRIQYGKYDEFLESSIQEKNHWSTKYFADNFNDFTEEVLVNNLPVEIEFDLDSLFDGIDQILSENQKNPMEKIDVFLGKKLHTEFSLINNIPENILYEKEVWAYLNCFVFFDLVKKRYLSDEFESESDDKIGRLFFCNGSQIDRTGLRWLWVLANSTYDNEYQYGLLETAREYIDPVKAIFERELGRNPIVFKSFVRALQLNNDKRIRSDKYKSIIPTHIRNLATMEIYESVEKIDDLANIFAREISSYIEQN